MRLSCRACLFGDFGVSFAATVAGRYTRFFLGCLWCLIHSYGGGGLHKAGWPRLSVRSDFGAWCLVLGACLFLLNGDFGVSFAATVAGRYTRGEPKP